MNIPQHPDLNPSFGGPGPELGPPTPAPQPCTVLSQRHERPPNPSMTLPRLVQTPSFRYHFQQPTGQGRAPKLKIRHWKTLQSPRTWMVGDIQGYFGNQPAILGPGPAETLFHCVFYAQQCSQPRGQLPTPQTLAHVTTCNLPVDKWSPEAHP